MELLLKGSYYGNLKKKKKKSKKESKHRLIVGQAAGIRLGAQGRVGKGGGTG